MYPVPDYTPRGRTVRHRVLANGIYWLETDRCKELLAVCYPIWSTELTNLAEQLGEQTEYDRANDIHNTMGYIFFPRQTSCIPIYEFMQTRPKWAGTLIDKPALMNAIWTVLPEYALLNNQQEQLGMNDIVSTLLRELGIKAEPNISPDHMIPIFPEAGEDFLLFDRECKNMLEVCPYCGEAVVSARSNFCAFCGAQLRELPPEIAAIVPPEEQRQKPMPVAIASVPDSMLDFLKEEYKVQDRYDTPDQSQKEAEDIGRLIELLESGQFVWFASKEQIQSLATFIGYRAQRALYDIILKIKPSMCWDDFVLFVRANAKVIGAVQAVVIHAVNNFDVGQLDFNLPPDALEYIEDGGEEQLIGVAKIFPEDMGEGMIDYLLIRAELEYFTRLHESDPQYTWERYHQELEENKEMWGKFARAFQKGLRQVDFAASWYNEGIPETEFMRRPDGQEES